MCGIIGVFNNKSVGTMIKKGLQKSFLTNSAIVQPINLMVDCKIYNWNELAQKYKIKANSDTELLAKLFKKTGKVCDTVPELDGEYAFAYWADNKVILTRDIIGIKPLFYSHKDGFAFASEKKVLEKLGFTYIQELNPRKHLTYEIDSDRIYFTDREFYKIKPENNAKLLQEKLIQAVKKRIPDRKLGLLFSGGIDSTLLALILRKLGVDFTCYTVAVDDGNLKTAEDLLYAKKVAKALDLKLKIIKLRIRDIPRYLKKIVPVIEDTNVTKVSVGLTFYPACELAKKDGVRIMFSGLGSEEIFAGYQRHKKATDINTECLSGLLKMYERDTYRDYTITMHNNIELRVPYLDTELVRYALKIPAKMKINGIEKAVLRDVAINLGLDKKFAMRKKKAAQYGSKTLRAIQKLTKQNKFKLKSEYLHQFYHNLNLAALISGGKDSLYAMHVMQQQNYKISCLVTIISQNPDSYMFHTPAIDMVSLQAKSMKIPIITQKTKGIKEKELNDLKTALMKAKEQYQIDGIVTGALYSKYQRDRVEKICNELNLKIFSPLWHINQETEMREIIDSGFEFILTAVAAEGLDKTWLGRIITHKDINRLAKLNKKIGLNIAGEGGEFESLVLDAPMFEKPIEINYEINSDKRTARLKITKAR